MALSFRNLKQIHVTIKESLSVGKTRCIARFPCDSTAFVFEIRDGLSYQICWLYTAKIHRSHRQRKIFRPFSFYTVSGKKRPPP